MLSKKSNVRGSSPPKHALRLGLLAMLTVSGWAATTTTPYGETKIVARALTPQEIHQYGLPEGTQISGGLETVGLGSPVYLEAQVSKGTSVDGVVWTLTSKPEGSAAALAESPLGRGVPIYDPGDRAYNSVAGRQLLVPDLAGRYTVEAAIQTPDGPEEATLVVTAGTYIGVGIIAKAQPDFPECALCHSDMASGWKDTGHATMFTRAIDGLASSHYNSDCSSCHTLGFDALPGAVNGGFDDVAAATGWTFPEELVPGNWLAMPEELQAVSNIQCENCHGPGSEHVNAKNRKATISVSYSSGDCGQCHDEAPYHLKNQEWNLSRHAIATPSPTGEGRESCVRCHSAIGFIDTIKGYPDPVRTDAEAITCAACHDPHDASGPHQLRKVDDVTLMNGHVVQAGGNGKICMNCHTSRRNAETYTERYASHFGPHYGPQTDMLAGTNAAEYGKDIPSSSHLYAVQDSCAGCHMHELATENPAHGLAGGHTFKPVWDAGTDDASDDVDLVGACIQCHGPVDTFNFARIDYDEDGVLEGVQTEVEGLMHRLGMLLPPIGQPDVAVTAEYTPSQLKAAFNYMFVREDGSLGIHNTSYAVGILRASLEDLGAASQPGVNPNDTDGDGLPDDWEITHFGSLDAQSRDDDADDDGLSNAFEFRAGTHPLLVDSDQDGFSDMAEIHANRDPLSSSDTPDTGSQIFHAAEFVFFSQTGKNYKVQSIPELGSESWADISDPIEGTGDMIQVFISTREHDKEFYRVIEIE